MTGVEVVSDLAGLVEQIWAREEPAPPPPAPPPEALWKPIGLAAAAAAAGDESADVRPAAVGEADATEQQAGRMLHGMLEGAGQLRASGGPLGGKQLPQQPPRGGGGREPSEPIETANLRVRRQLARRAAEQQGLRDGASEALAAADELNVGASTRDPNPQLSYTNPQLSLMHHPRVCCMSWRNLTLSSTGSSHPLEQRWARQVGSRFELAWAMARTHGVRAPAPVGWTDPESLEAVWAAPDGRKGEARGTGTPQHGLFSDKMALITSGCGTMCSPSIKWHYSPRVVCPAAAFFSDMLACNPLSPASWRLLPLSRAQYSNPAGESRHLPRVRSGLCGVPRVFFRARMPQ